MNASQQKELDDAWEGVGRLRRHYKVVDLERMAKNRSARRRLRALLIMRKQIAEGRDLKSYLRLARRMIDDPNNNCRWQALIVVGEFIEDHPDEIWTVVKRYATHEDSDMRMGVACVLLEHLLGHHWRRFHREARREAADSALFAETLGMCRDFREPRRKGESRRTRSTGAVCE